MKICCIQDENEAWTAIHYGASALGFVSDMPSGLGPIAEEKIAQIRRVVPPPIATFLLTCKTKPEDIIAQHKRIRANCIQLVDRMDVAALKSLGNALPGIWIIPVVHVLDEKAIDEALALSEFADAILLDSGNPNLAVKELGGTGRIHDWTISRRIREQLDIPVFLAGGLTPENVRQAIEAVEPFCIDVCSRVRTGVNLDETKLARFFAEIEKS